MMPLWPLATAADCNPTPYMSVTFTTITTGYDWSNLSCTMALQAAWRP